MSFFLNFKGRESNNEPVEIDWSISPSELLTSTNIKSAIYEIDSLLKSTNELIENNYSEINNELNTQKQINETLSSGIETSTSNISRITDEIAANNNKLDEQALFISAIGEEISSVKEEFQVQQKISVSEIEPDDTSTIWIKK